MKENTPGLACVVSVHYRWKVSSGRDGPFITQKLSEILGNWVEDHRRSSDKRNRKWMEWWKEVRNKHQRLFVPRLRNEILCFDYLLSCFAFIRTLNNVGINMTFSGESKTTSVFYFERVVDRTSEYVYFLNESEDECWGKGRGKKRPKEQNIILMDQHWTFVSVCESKSTIKGLRANSNDQIQPILTCKGPGRAKASK